MTNIDQSGRAAVGVRRVEYRVLGPVQARVDGTAVELGGPKQRGVIAVLIAAAGRAVSVDVMLQAMYGEDASPTARATLHTYVSNLRHLLGDVIIRSGDAYRLEVGNASIDAAEFERAFGVGVATKGADDAAAELGRALSMWRGHPYSDVETHGYLDGEITRLTELRLAALEARTDADLRAGRHREVIAELDALTVEHPFRESLRAMHMLALYRSGRQVEALRAFTKTRVALADGLGLDPSSELKDLERRILNQDRSLLIDTGPVLLQRRAVLVADLDDSGWRDPAEREAAFARREAALASVADSDGAMMLSPKGTAGYAVFDDPIRAVRAARSLVDQRMRVAVDFGDLQIHHGEPVGPPLARAARLVAIAHPGQVLLSAAAHEALTAAAEPGWAAESLGRFDIVGLDRGVQIYQLVGHGFRSEFPVLDVGRVPPPVPRSAEGSLPGYELRTLIGTGQLSEVYRAYQPSVGREVAVRIFGPGMVSDPLFVRRFETASQRIARVEHPHLLPLLDYWREPNRALMVTRLATGGTLTARIPPTGFQRYAALAIFTDVASAIASAHRHGVVHGRIRPGNVLLDDESNAFVSDLGVDEICIGVTAFDDDVYDAPERVNGELASRAVDIYSLGVLAHHMLTGAPQLPDRPPSTSEASISSVVARATDPDVQQRQQTVDDLIGDLTQALEAPTDSTTVFVSTRNPYRGLQAFELADADDFHGRDRQVAEMVGVLERERLLVVVGASGIGKSSAVRAGLVSALWSGAINGSEAWVVTVMTPGRSPFDELTLAIGRVATSPVPNLLVELNAGRSLDAVVRLAMPAGSQLLLVVDQLEELFTETTDEEERRLFVRMVTEVAGRDESATRIVLTLRADYFDRPLGYAGFSDAIRGRTVALGAMSADELADAISCPAAGVEVNVEGALIERIVADAQSQPGALPLVQHTMTELFARRHSNVLTLASFMDAGGLTGAIGRRAEEIFIAFDEHTRLAAQLVFLRLVNVDEQHEDTRRRVRRPQLEQTGLASAHLEEVLREYGSHRLLTFDRDATTRAPTVEIAHEALLTEWQRLKDWVDDAREDLLTRRRIESATHEWLTAGSDASFLFRGGRLELAESWSSASRFDVNEDERQFLAASRERSDRESKTKSRRRRLLVSLLAMALLVMTSLGAFARTQRNTAETKSRETRARELSVQSQLALNEDPELAMMLALAAARATSNPLPEAVSALHQATQSLRLVANVDALGLVAIAQSSDGKLLAVDRRDATGFVFVDPKTGATVHEVETSRKPGSQALAFNPSASEIAVAYQAAADEPIADTCVEGGTVAVERFEVPSGRSLGTMSGPPGCYESLAFSSDGRWLLAVHVTSGSSAEIVGWDVGSNAPPVVVERGDAFRFVPGSDDVVIRGAEPRLLVVDVPTGDVVREIATTPGFQYLSMDVDSTGRLLALSSFAAHRVEVYALDDGELVRTLELPSASTVRFSQDGRQLAVSGNENLIRIFDTDTSVETQLTGLTDEPIDMIFSPDGSRLIAPTGGNLGIWDLTGVGPAGLGNFRAPDGAGFVSRIEVDHGLSEALVGMHDGDVAGVHRIDLSTGLSEIVVADLRPHPLVVPQLSADLHVVAAIGADFVTRVTNIGTGTSITLAPCEAVVALDHSGRFAVLDGGVLCTDATAFPPPLPGPGLPARVIDLRSNRTVLALGDSAVWHAAFGPPGSDDVPQVVAVIEVPAEIVSLHDLTTGNRLGSVSFDGLPLAVAFSPDGRRVAVVTSSGQLAVIEVDRLAASTAASDATAWSVVASGGSIQSVSVSASGLIATASSVGNVRVWSSGGDMLADIPLEPDDFPFASFVAGTDTLFYEDGNRVVRRFVVDTDSAERLATSLLTRNLTPDECARYFRDEECPTFSVSGHDSAASTALSFS